MARSISEIAVPGLEAGRLAERRAPAVDPVGDPAKESIGPDARRAEEPASERTVAEQRARRFGPLVGDTPAEEAAELFTDLPDAEDLGAGDVDDEGRARRVAERGEADRARVGLPDDIDVAHAQVDGVARRDHEGEVHEHAIAQLT